MSEILRTENGEAKRLPAPEAMREIDHAMMQGKRHVDEMYGAKHTWYIRYRDGREVRFAPAPQGEEATENVVSVRGGKVHSPMPGDDPYPLCREGGMNQRLRQLPICGRQSRLLTNSDDSSGLVWRAGTSRPLCWTTRRRYVC